MTKQLVADSAALRRMVPVQAGARTFKYGDLPPDLQCAGGSSETCIIFRWMSPV